MKYRDFKAKAKAQAKVKAKAKSKAGGLNPEWDAVNMAITEGPICSCGHYQAHPHHDEIGCIHCKCMRLFSSPKGESKKVAIRLPEHVKSGGKGGYSGGNGYVGGGGFTYTNYAPTCRHEGDKLVYEANGKALYGATGYALKEYSGAWDLIIDLANNLKPPSAPPKFVRGLSATRFKALEKYVLVEPYKQIKSEILQLEWPDMGISPVTLQFWLDLWEMLPAKTVVACMGGHGRTGTCLAALMIASGVDYWTAFETVRAEHCSKAIESFTQERYLHNLYLDMLENAAEVAKAAQDETLLNEILEDVKYAVENAPQLASSKGSKSYTKVGSYSGPADIDHLLFTDGSSLPITISKKGPGAFAHVGHVLECVIQSCKNADCKIEAHQGWIDLDTGDVVGMADD